jgi:hypothetical protein
MTRKSADEIELRPDERFAFEVARRVLTATIEPWDIGGRQRAVDAMVHYPDGRAAALEVSSIGPQDEAAIMHYLASRGQCKTIPGLRHTWIVEVPRNFHPADMRKIETALRSCEERGLKHLSDLASADQGADTLLLRSVRAHIVARPEDAGNTEPRVYYMLPAMGGWPGPGMASLAAELAEVLRTSTIQSKLRKLAATGLTERHLILAVRPTVFSFPVFDALAFGGPLPDQKPDLPAGLSQIWLITGIRAGGVVRGISGHGWRRDNPFDNAPA